MFLLNCADFWAHCRYFHDGCVCALEIPSGLCWWLNVSLVPPRPIPVVHPAPDLTVLPPALHVGLWAPLSTRPCAGTCFFLPYTFARQAPVFQCLLCSPPLLSGIESQKLNSESGMPVLFLELSTRVPPNAWGKANTEGVLWSGWCFYGRVKDLHD